MAELTDTDIRERVRERYAAAATAVAESTGAGCCGAPAAIAGCGPDISSTDKHGNEVFGATLYEEAGDPALQTAVEASLGCGVPTAVADLHEGETVLDLGSGAGADVLISARRVGPPGKAIGLDMTDEMLELARANAAEAGVANVEFVKGYLEEIPLPEAVKLASLGCGNPTAVAELREGETVLDLGSGGGIDVLLSARRVGPTGKAYGLDMTDEMLELARRSASEAGARNVEFLKGRMEAIPLPGTSVDVVISNCVVNLSADKPRVLREVARVLRPGGRVGISDVVADASMDEATRRDMQQWTGCIAGALTREEYERHLAAAGLEDVEVRETHRVHESAGSAIIQARKASGG